MPVKARALRRIAGETPPDEAVLLPVQLVVRDSCGGQTLIRRGFEATREFSLAMEMEAGFRPYDSAERNEFAIAR